MSVIIGSARSSFGNTAAGDQSGGKEVSTQSWYRHSKGWRVFRAKDPYKRKLMAMAMRSACANDKIGYSQPDRNALFNQIKSKRYDPSKASEKTNCDCSSLVRVCCYFAGIEIKNFTTDGEPAALLATGEFVELKGSIYTESSQYLCEGDILCTATKGHTAIVLSNGSKYVPETVVTKSVKIINGNCYVRSEPAKTGDIYGTAREGESYPYQGEKSSDGWHKIKFGSRIGWVSGKYSKLED